MNAFRIHMNDKVMIITGRDAGGIGKVTRILRKKNAVIVEKKNMYKRHTKPNKYTNTSGDIIEKEMPINASNVMIVCSACGKPTRVGYRYVEDGDKKKKVRFCKKCNEVLK